MPVASIVAVPSSGSGSGSTGLSGGGTSEIDGSSTTPGVSPGVLPVMGITSSGTGVAGITIGNC